MLTFLATDRPFRASRHDLHRAHPRIARAAWLLPATTSARTPATTSNTRAVYPYAYFVLLYQQPVYFPGVLFLLVVLAGLVCRGQRTGAGCGGAAAACRWALAAAASIRPRRPC